MLWILFLIAAFVDLPNSSSLKLSENLPKCYINDADLNNCILKASTALRPFVRDGIKELRFPSFDPAVLSYFTVKQEDSLMNYTATFWNYTLYDLYKYNTSDIEFDFKNPASVTLKGKMRLGKIPFTSTYEFIGEMLKIYLNGSGIHSGVAGPIDATFQLTGKLIKRKDVEYLNVTKVSIKLNIENLQTYYSNTFNGNEQLGNATNALLNENSKELLKAMNPVLEIIFEQHVFRYAKWLTKRVPFYEFFLKSPEMNTE